MGGKKQAATPVAAVDPPPAASPTSLQIEAAQVRLRNELVLQQTPMGQALLQVLHKLSPEATLADAAQAIVRAQLPK